MLSCSSLLYKRIQTHSSCCCYCYGKVTIFFSLYSFVWFAPSFIVFVEFFACHISNTFIKFASAIYLHKSILSFSQFLCFVYSTQKEHRAVGCTSKTSKIYIRWILCFVGCCSFGSIFFFCLLHFPSTCEFGGIAFMETNIIFIYFIGMVRWAPALFLLFLCVP